MFSTIFKFISPSRVKLLSSISKAQLIKPYAFPNYLPAASFSSLVDSRKTFIKPSERILRPSRDLWLTSSFQKNSSTTTEFDASYEVREAKVDLESLGGYEEILMSLVDVVEFLQAPATFTKKGIKPPKRILLSGPPGVGKTYAAEAIAGHSGVPVIVVSAASLKHVYVGGTERNLRNLFKLARENAPCVLCIDEIGAIGQKRFEDPKDSSAHHANSEVAQLLTLLDSDNSGVIVIATTNNKKTLDPALISPGRFDRNIELSMPAQKDRYCILAIHTKDKTLDPAAKLEDLSALSAGFSGAKLAVWVNEAAIRAKRENSEAITLKHFDEARSIIETGSLGRRNPYPEAKRYTAIHEVGHAVIGHLLGLTVYKLSVLLTATDMGRTIFLPDERLAVSKETLLNEICFLLAGRAAEQLFAMPVVGAESDFMRAKTRISLMLREGMGSTLSGLNYELDIENILLEQMSRATKLLEENKSAVERLVTNLINEEELYREDFLNIFAGNKIDPQKSFQRFSFWSSAHAYEFKLPPKKLYSKQLIKPMPIVLYENGKDGMGFTLKQIAQAINVSEDCIVKFKESSWGAFNIYLLPGTPVEKTLAEFKRYSVEYHFDPRGLEKTITIYSFGMKNFIQLLKEKNEPGSDENPGASNFKP